MGTQHKKATLHHTQDQCGTSWNGGNYLIARRANQRDATVHIPMREVADHGLETLDDGAPGEEHERRDAHAEAAASAF